MTQEEQFEEEDTLLGYWDRAGVFHEGWPADDMDASTYTPSSPLLVAMHDKAFAEAEKTGQPIGG